MLQKHFFHLTLACDLELGHTDLHHVCDALSCHGGHLCKVI